MKLLLKTQSYVLDNLTLFKCSMLLVTLFETDSESLHHEYISTDVLF